MALNRTTPLDKQTGTMSNQEPGNDRRNKSKSSETQNQQNSDLEISPDPETDSEQDGQPGNNAGAYPVENTELEMDDKTVELGIDDESEENEDKVNDELQNEEEDVNEQAGINKKTNGNYRNEKDEG